MRPSAVILSSVLMLDIAPSALAQSDIVIGTASPLSGPGAHLGKDIENGARMAIEDLNAKGVTIGGRKVTWRLSPEDDGSDPKTGTAVAQKLVDAGVAGVVGHLNSGTTVPASKIYANAGIPQISPAATTPVYTQQGYKTAFRVVANDSLIGRALARYAVDTLNAKNIAVIDDRTAFGQGLADQFAKEVKRQGKGATIISRQFTNDRATDFTAILTQIRARKPDVIFYGGMDAVAGPMLKQMKALGIGAKLVAGDGSALKSCRCSLAMRWAKTGCSARWPVALPVPRKLRSMRSSPAIANATACRCKPTRRMPTTPSWCLPPRCSRRGRPSRRNSCPRWRRCGTRASPARSHSIARGTCRTQP